MATIEKAQIRRCSRKIQSSETKSLEKVAGEEKRSGERVEHVYRMEGMGMGLQAQSTGKHGKGNI